MTTTKATAFSVFLISMFFSFAVLAQQLPELGNPSTLSGTPTSARFYGGVTADGGESFGASFELATPITITGSVLLEDRHVGATGNVYVVVQLDDQLYFQDSSGGYVSWDGALETLGAARPNKTFSVSEPISVVDGVALGVVGSASPALSVWLAYDSTVTPAELFFSGEPISVTGTLPAPSNPFQELYDQGVDRYLGKITPAYSEQIEPGVMEYGFASTDGPMCYTGADFTMNTRDGASNNLLIFLQGGGFCGPEDCSNALETGIPFIFFGILNPLDPNNPVANYDVGYVPYCDGSAMMGDRQVDSDGDGNFDRFFRGAQNLSASLDVIARTYPSPDHIVLAGNSAGGFAVHAALPLVRQLYPEVPIDIINDSGNGILRPGGMQDLADYWGAGAFFPTSCTECIGTDGNLTDYHGYQLAQDQNIKMAYISSKQDATIAAGLPGGGETLKSELIEAAAELNAAYSERFNSLIANGSDHTYLIRMFEREIAGVTVRKWLADMISGSSDWQSKTE